MVWRHLESLKRVAEFPLGLFRVVPPSSTKPEQSTSAPFNNSTPTDFLTPQPTGSPTPSGAVLVAFLGLPFTVPYCHEFILRQFRLTSVRDVGVWVGPGGQ
jgi:hypothetical protein